MSTQIGEINLDYVLDLLLELVMLQVNADAADIFLLDKITAQPILCRSLGLKNISSLSELSHSWKGLIWRVIQKRDLVSLPNIWIESSSLVRGDKDIWCPGGFPLPGIIPKFSVVSTLPQSGRTGFAFLRDLLPI